MPAPSEGRRSVAAAAPFQEERSMSRRLSTLLLFVVWSANARAETVVLANGDTLTGEVIERAADHVVIEHPQLGRVRLSLDQLETETETPVTPGLFGSHFLKGWTRGIDVGLNGEQGNSDSISLTAGFDFAYDDDFKRWSIEGRYFYNRTDEGEADNNGRIDSHRDWLFRDSRWFTRAALRYQFDRFESWKHRTVLSLGPGYRLVRTEAQTLDVVLAPTFTREWGDRDVDKAEVALGLDYAWEISERQSLTFSNQFFVEATPSMGEFRNVTSGEWKVVLNRDPSLNLKMGAENEYESDVEPDDERNDVKYYLALGLDF
jgi:putative salt-induced outer membrane protein YdiY